MLILQLLLVRLLLLLPLSKSGCVAEYLFAGYAGASPRAAILRAKSGLLSALASNLASYAARRARSCLISHWLHGRSGLFPGKSGLLMFAFRHSFATRSIFRAGSRSRFARAPGGPVYCRAGPVCLRIGHAGFSRVVLYFGRCPFCLSTVSQEVRFIHAQASLFTDASHAISRRLPPFGPGLIFLSGGSSHVRINYRQSTSDVGPC